MKEIKRSLKVAALIIYAFFMALGSATVYAADRLEPNQMLKRGQSLTSGTGEYKLAMQDDGNLVLYAGNKALWASNTDGQAVEKCVMQSDGNLVLYLYNGKPVWASNTNGKPNSYLLVQNDGNVVIYHNQSAVWATNTNR
jgi:hypothetical protein